MIGFNVLLRAEGIDPEDVKLVRHQDTRQGKQITIYHHWKAADGSFELYQRIQRRPVFNGAKWIASFVAVPLTPPSETLFVGMYENRGVGKAKAGDKDPVTGRNVGGLNLYNLIPSSRLERYRGRLVIDWGQGYRRWDQWAVKKDKPVLEIRRSESEPPFPGFLDFRETLSSLKSVPTSWRSALSAVKGVYVLVHPKKGKQYVGSATGAQGFWGRWEQYVASGHGGNRKMREISPTDYQISILEVAASSTGPEEIARMEMGWKKKLQSVKFGLNANY